MYYCRLCAIRNIEEADCNVCEDCIQAAREDKQKNTEFRLLLNEASKDLFHWGALAKKQREELPAVDHLPCGPTTHGIEVTEQLRDKIHAALAR